MKENTEYKGIFYGENTSHKYFEGGAHFSYHALVKILSELQKTNFQLKQNQDNEIKENKKIEIPILAKHRNNSMSNLIQNKTDIKIEKQNFNNDIYNKSRNKNFSSTKNNYTNNNTNLFKNINNNYKEITDDISYNQIIKMPMIYNISNNKKQKKNFINLININKNKTIHLSSNSNNIKQNNNFHHIKLNSTTGFQNNNTIKKEKTSYFNHFLINNYKNLENKLSRNKKGLSFCNVSSSLINYSNNKSNYEASKKKTYKVKSVDYSDKRKEDNSSINFNKIIVIKNDNKYKNKINMNVFNVNGNNKSNVAFLYGKNNYDGDNRSNSKVTLIKNGLVKKNYKKHNEKKKFNLKFLNDKISKK